MDSLPDRRCPKCGETKPRTVEFWNRNSRTKDGLYGWCKDCTRQNLKKYNRQTRIRQRGGLAPILTRVSHADRPIPEGAKVLEKHCPRCRETKPANYFSAQLGQSDGLSSYCVPCKLEYGREWRQKNRDKQRAQDRQKRAKRASAQGSHTWRDVAAQYTSQKGKCYWCYSEVNDDYHVDHRIPLSRGGTNNPDNIVIACPLCNRLKNSKMPHEFVGRLL